MRTVGVEEELLLVDARTGVPAPVAEQVLAADADADDRIVAEFLAEMIEMRTRPHTDAGDLAAELCALRAEIGVRAGALGTAAAALSTSPLPATGTVMPVARFARIAAEFGVLAREHLTCGRHVHVEVADEDEGAAVLDRTRVWLPTLLALTAGSPFRGGEDTGYASFRWHLMARWPISGPPVVVGSGEGYRRWVDDLLGTGVVLDEGMVYLDARLSSHLPTVEVRVADVCPDVRVTVLLALLVRALVETAAGQWHQDRRVRGGRAGVAAAPDTTHLRLATWRASRHGLTGELVDPATGSPAPASRVVADLVDHVRPALVDSGDVALVEDAVRRLLGEGGEAQRQREVYRRSARLSEVVSDAVRRTLVVPV